MEGTIIRNCSTGQRAVFKLPCSFSQFERIGVDENFSGQVFFENGPDTFGYGLDGYLYVDELRGFLNYYANSLNPFHFDYMMLSRYQSDCNYFLGYGRRDEGRLYFESVSRQISEMKKLWNKFPDGQKPEWLTWEDILQYERRMSPENTKRVKRVYDLQVSFENWISRRHAFKKTAEDFEELLQQLEKAYAALPDEEKPADLTEFDLKHYRRIYEDVFREEKND